MEDGEKGNFQGILFDDSCQTIITLLGYKELSSGKYGIDNISEPPSSGMVIKPGFAPDGVTAFEFKSGFDYTDKEITKLAGKIKDLVKYDIKGGVIISDLRLSDNSYKEGLKHGVFLWDIRDMCFLTSKILVVDKMRKVGSVKESQVTSGVTYFWTPHAKSLDPLGKYYTADIVIFFHNPLMDVDAKLVDDVIKKIHSSILDKCTPASLLPLKSGIEIHSRGFVRKDVINRTQKILDNYSSDKDISYSFKNLFTYYVGPWKAFLV